MQTGPHVPSPGTSTALTPRPSRPGLRCIGWGCDTLVVHARICDSCMHSAAIDLCRRFERELIDVGFTAGSSELKAALAGSASCRSVIWYETNSELGRITNREAHELRNAADIACFLVALGGVQALERMPGRPTFREAVAAWAEHEDSSISVSSAPEPAIVSRMAAEADPMAGAARMARLFAAQERLDAGVMANPETRFDAYTFALLVLALVLLLHF